ncbi:hypothetical protein [Candidatus Uabimicrobium amorphum]|uniref:Uncharacterized protein n=1 Tax=Uabimicrobium amorphum TaxID=2596890 RepID=A0A5S9IU26_UABAM|nr:hypothetical protein [Candidatus Uabimicrobium amorphum]BBM86625.1 hypothetical protein UABAM_05011 [Candidatus Uabimicrobium amorphum]
MTKVYFVLFLSGMLFANSFIVEEIAANDSAQQEQVITGNGFIAAVVQTTDHDEVKCERAHQTDTHTANGILLSLDNGKTWQHNLLKEYRVNFLQLGDGGSVVAVTADNRYIQISLRDVKAPGEKVDFLHFPPTKSKKSPKWGPVLNDIMSHEVDFNNYDDLVTLAHETSHGIHSHIRNKMNKTGKTANGFYVLNNRAVVVVEPNMRKSKVAKYVPPSLRGSRYYTYVSGAPSWDDRPLYIWDEWNAYVNGSEAGIDLVDNDLWKYGWRDAVAGTLEFVVYSIAVAMAAKEHDPQYFNNYDQFREFLAWNVKRSMELYRKGAKIEHFKYEKQEKYYKDMQTSPDAEQFRQFCRELFGGTWTEQNLGF